MEKLKKVSIKVKTVLLAACFSLLAAVPAFASDGAPLTGDTSNLAVWIIVIVIVVVVLALLVILNVIRNKKKK